jgi:hypothetical protein
MNIHVEVDHENDWISVGIDTNDDQGHGYGGFGLPVGKAEELRDALDIAIKEAGS